jgi:hypothetical protein
MPRARYEGPAEVATPFPFSANEHFAWQVAAPVLHEALTQGIKGLSFMVSAQPWGVVGIRRKGDLKGIGRCAITMCRRQPPPSPLALK